MSVPGRSNMEESTIEVNTERSMSLSSTPQTPNAARNSQDPSQTFPHENTIPNLDGASQASTPSLGPRRGSFASDIPLGHAMPKPLLDTPPGPNLTSVEERTSSINKSDLHMTFSTSLAPKSATLLSQAGTEVGYQDENLTDSDPEFRSSTPLTQPPRSTDILPPQSYIPSPPQGYYSTYQLTETPQMPPPKREVTTSARRVKQYTLDDGTVVSGKGLGRGRPGIKRGPRNPKHTLIPSNSIPAPVIGPEPSPAASSGPSSRKRQRTDSDTSNIRTTFSTSTSTDSQSRESSVEYAPAEETRSGRKTAKLATTYPQVPSDSASPASKRPKPTSNNSTTASPSISKYHPKIKRRVYRGREQLALCEHCLRGHGPPGNVIVFCDACNKCWHQRCHDPQVPQSVIADTKAEWFCSDCDRILHGKKNKKSTTATSTTAAAASINLTTNAPAQPAFMGPLIPGSSLTHSQKQSYLSSLNKEKLISLILSASELAPALPLFQAPAPQIPHAKLTSNYTTPVTSSFTPPRPSNGNTSSAASGVTPGPGAPGGGGAAGGEEDEGYDSYFDEHAALYPKPGHGIKLPPESTDLHILLEGKGCRTFSHWVRGMGSASAGVSGREFSGTGDVIGLGRGRGGAAGAGIGGAGAGREGGPGVHSHSHGPGPGSG